MMDFFAPIYWLVNGALLVIYLLIDHILLLLLLPLLLWTVISSPAEQRMRAMISGGLGLIAASMSPSPVPFWMLVMSVAGVIVVLVERFNPISLRWRVIQGIALYSLLGIGFFLYQLFSPTSFRGNSGALVDQGATYVNVIISIALHVYPLGYLVMLAQAVWVHAPISASPQSLISDVRSRGKR